jgi:poly(3-hydroxyalkanoate) depolymerase
MKAFVFRTLNLDGQSIRTAVRPGKPHLTPLMVFNGIGASLELVLPFVRELDPDQEVIAFDVPGVGGSPAPLLPYSFKGLSRTVAKMLDALEYDQVNVIGVSWGGFLAQQFAHDHPKRCGKLILAATSAGVLSVPPSPKVLALMASPLRYTNPEHGAKIAPDIYGGSFRHNKALATAHASKMKSAGGRGYYYQMAAVYWWTSVHWLHRIKQPTLVLAGNDDPLIPLVNMRVLANLIPNAELHVIDDGHLFLITQAKAVAPIVMTFLSAAADEDKDSDSLLDSDYEQALKAL